MKDWRIRYEVIDRSVNPRDSFSRTASFRQLKWNRDPLERQVLIFGVNRTVPVTERNEFRRFTKKAFEVPEADTTTFKGRIVEEVSRILGKDITGFRELKADDSGRVTLLLGRDEIGGGFSEFHFGAGESSVIRMIAQIEMAEENSLVLIEEIENGLHPVATVKLVDYLLSVSKRRSLQVVMTTHSDAALVPLPDKAVWVATPTRIFQGKMDVVALRAITGRIDRELVVFTEDQFAKIWVEAVIRSRCVEVADRLEIYALEGDGTAVTMAKSHDADPSISTKALAIVDGDSSIRDEGFEYIYRLPGEMPEPHIFDQILDRWDSVGGQLTVRLLQPFARTEQVGEICKDLRRSNMDEHLLFAQLGEKLGFVPEQTVAMAFANTWADTYTREADELATRIRELVPSPTS